MSSDMPSGKKTVSDKQIIQAIREHEDPVVSAQELADMFDHTRQWAHDRLEKLEAEGEAQRKKGGPRSVMWWVEE